MSHSSTIFVPASIGNVGPGFDVLGLAISGLGDTVKIELKENSKDCITKISGLDADLVPLNPDKNAAMIAAKKYLSLKKSALSVHMSIERQIPISGGLGSSAAASVAGAMGAAKALGSKYQIAEIIEASLAGESFVAGSHLDNIAPSLLGGLCLVLSNDPAQIYSLKIKKDWYLSLVTPDSKLETKTSRAALPKSLVQKDWVRQMAKSVGLASAFSEGNEELLKKSLDDHYAEPIRAKFIKDFYSMKKAALGEGALACSISGAGPSVFAICPNKEIATRTNQAMLAALTCPPRFKHIASILKKGAYHL